MSIYDTLNQEQREAVFHTEGPLLLLAGAGSGKTRALTHRIAYLIQEMGVNPWNILAITFTNKAAEEMRDRVDRLVGFGAEQIWVATFHSTCLRILRRHIDLLGYDNHFTIYDRDDQKTVIKDICKRFGIDNKQVKEQEFIHAISTAKDRLIGPVEYQMNVRYDFTRKKFGDVYQEYQEVMKKNNALDFDDLICKTVELFRSNPEVLLNYQERFHYISVDEYQDTNHAQFELVRLLAQRRRNLCVVGDDDQSIYKFRGADIRNILDFEKVYPEAKVIKLEQNYRSTPNVLDVANAVIRNNRGRKEKALWTRKEEGESVRFRQFDSAYDEADYIVGDIQERTGRGGCKYGDCAVLYRTNAQSRLFEERLVSEGIPYDVVGGVNFYSRKEIKDVLAYLKTIDNGQDDVAVKRIINIPKRGIGASTIAKVEDYAQMRDISFYDALREADNIMDIGKAITKIDAFVTLIQSFRSKVEFLNLGELIQDVLEKINFRDYLEDFDEDAQDRMENVEELKNKAAAFQEVHDDATLSLFLEEVALVSDIDQVEGVGSRVLLMTLHSAKGLEFSNVYMAGMEDDLFPSYQSLNAEDDSALEEERRLAYVGITRAKENLTLTCARSRRIHGEMQYHQVSRFVREIPDALLDSTEPVPKIRQVAWEDEGVERRAYDPRPKAKLPAKKPSAKPNKPFIAQGIEGLNRIAGVSKGMPYQAPVMPDYGVGDRVSHTKYGQGTVLALQKDVRDYKVTVHFDQAGQKIMFATFAKLKKC